ncbi:MAG: UDP-N-acetylmuramoyl-L-alanyl-D-glutamate--2,6-diaminopimelate ligase [Pseudomonadota bacterium]
MKLSELAGEVVTSDPEIAGITADSRAVENGFLFAALPGTVADGKRFISQAEKRGAAAVLACPGAHAGVPIVFDESPRRRLSDMAAKFYPRQPSVIAGITGTNGKTSTAQFATELWSLCGESAGSVGTLGAVGENYEYKLIHTTPDPVTLHKVLDEMAGVGITHLAMEVSSHGLAQHRADGARFSIAAFTNITQDHLDYHSSFDDYFDAKARLFKRLLPASGAIVLNADGAGADAIMKIAEERGVRTITTGKAGYDIKLANAAPRSSGLDLEIQADGENYKLHLSLIGAFQVENALLAAGIVIASGEPASRVLPLLESLTGVSGRMQRVAKISMTEGSAGIYVDYAHTPDAVAAALRAIRPHAAARVIVIIGAGGDRDREKRRLMGASAQKYADAVIVTDDNPRTENPGYIRRDVMGGCPEAVEIGDRREAISYGIGMLGAGDVLLIVGKGHETGQQVGEKIFPFNDAQVARDAAQERMKELGR